MSSSFKYIEKDGKTYLVIGENRIEVLWNERWVPAAEHIQPGPQPGTATFTATSLINCYLTGIASGDEIAVDQSLTFTVTGTENNLVGASISNNGVAYTAEEIASLITDEGENWFEFTIPVVNGNIIVSFEFEGDEPEARIYFEDPETGEEITDLSMVQGETTNIYDYIQFENMEDTTVTLSCDNLLVINLTTAGVMEAVGSVGEGATITVTSVEDPTITAELYVEIIDEEPVSEIAVSFYSDSLNSTGLNWDGQTMEPGDEIDVSFTANNLVSNSRFIDIEDIVPDFSVEVTNDGNEDTGATITRTGSGMNTQWRVQTVAQGDVEVIVNYNPVTFNDDVFSGEHALYTNMTQVDFANLGDASIASSFSQNSVWDSYDTQLNVNTHAVPLYSPDGFYNQVLQSEITANPAQHKGFWLYIDPTSHNPVVCCVHGTEGAVASMNDFESFNVLDQQSGQSLDCIKKFKDENFNGDINVANFFFEDLREEITGTGHCFLFYDKSN